MKSKPRSLLGIEPLDSRQILGILNLAKRMNPKRPRITLRGRRIALLFYENSTRTRTSFEIAAKLLGASTIVIHATTSSIEKGESLKDTGLTLESIVDGIVMRHPSSGAPDFLARHIRIPIINAGDGMHAHPSQALLDAFTILQHRKSLKGLRIVTIGPKPVVEPRPIGFNIAGKDVVLCDDVLYTGRTVRAALDALFDQGRPRSVKLLALIDRGHRELPIEASFVGRRVQTSEQEMIEVKLTETDQMEKVLLVERVPESRS